MERHTSRVRVGLVAAFGVFVAAAGVEARQAQVGQSQGAQNQDDPLKTILASEDYLAPPQSVMDVVLAPRNEDLRLNMDPSGRWFLNPIRELFPDLERFARTAYDLGQFQVDPIAKRSRRLSTRNDPGFEILSRDLRQRIRVDVPDGARVSNAEWSPDGSQLAFYAHFDDATHIYIADAEDGDSRRLTETPVLPTLVTGFEWTADGEHIVTVLRPANMGDEPERPAVPETPMVRLTAEGENRLRTYFDLLEDPHEMMLVEYFATGQLARIEVESGDVDLIGAPAMIEDVDPSPGGDFFRVTAMKKPFSYVVPTSSAGNVEELWDAQGNTLEVLDESELSEGQSGGNDDDDEDDRPERRGLTWRTDGPGMMYLQRAPRPGQDEDEEEEQEDEQPRMDRVVFWLPPFDSTSTQIVYQTEDQIGSASFDASGRILFLSRDEDDTETLSAVFLDDPGQEHVIFEHDSDDLYEDPGSPLRMSGPTGGSVIRTSADGTSIWLEGTQYFEDPLANAPRPFLDRVNIRTAQKERIFQSDPDVYETISEVLNGEVTELIISRESPTMVPNQWRVNLVTGEEAQLTRNPDHAPQITAARRELFTIVRPDGFKSRVTVTLPHNYTEGTMAPGMFWFYPREYTEQDEYDEGFERYNKNDFPSVGSRSMEILTLLGYAVIEPDVPIVGPEGQRNDEYVHDLRNTLSAVIDSVTRRGWVDRDRLGIGGHSYGAFSTANAMVHTPFFKAGIAGDGNYNRSLTPAGFQSERRDLWEAQDLYIEMSPFFQADRMTGALLMYHGMDDHNVGTHPDHARRMFHALNVLGKTASLYMYPFEDHGPATRETTLDLWARWVAWLDRYVKQSATTRVTTDDGAR